MEGIEKILLPKIENQLSECDAAIEKIRKFKYRPEERMVIYMMKKWTSLGIHFNNMLIIINSLKQMAFINETEDRKSLFFLTRFEL